MSTDGAGEQIGAPRATVVGLGLIGSSVAAALRREGWLVTGSDVRAEREKRALELEVIDAIGIDPSASIGVVATAVEEIASVAEALLASSSSMVVTDVGSVKGEITTAVTSPRFVGGHPMAGSEQEGPDGANPDLFVGATWILTPTTLTDDDAFRRVRDVVVSFGADPVELLAERHDALVALVSHVPHLVAATLMTVASERATEHAVLLRLAAGGFRDMTRIAAGESAMWPGVFSQNAEAVLVALDAVRERLDEARAIVETHDRAAIVDLLETARHARRNLPARIVRPELIVECRIPVPDRPGVLAEVTTVLGEAGVNIADFEIAHSAEGDRGVIIVSIDAEAAPVARAALVARGYRPSLPGQP